MGLKLKNPIIAGASALTANLDSIKRLEDAGAGAIVTKSLFEEEIQLERFKYDEDMEKNNYRNPEMITVHPHVAFAGPAEHLMWVRKTKESTGIPLIGSLNAIHPDVWIEYAKQLEQTGVDALECNLFASPQELAKRGAAVEEEQVQLAAQLVQSVTIPVSFKLSHFYTNPLNVIQRFSQVGAAGFVLFNRLFEPDLDIEKQKHISPFNFSHETDYRLPLRYAGLLEGEIEADICCSTGIFSGETVLKMLLAGACAVQTVSALFRNGYDHIGTMLRDVEQWMERTNSASIAEFRGRLSKRHSSDPWAYTRSQYARLLINWEKIVGNAPTL
jgi:dihydroorotate dehydrogenase (fumarate)